MRGIVSGGMLVALSDLGLLHCFDSVYGVSAGAINAAYCYSDQITEGLDIYLRHLNNRRFFMLQNVLHGDLLDLSYLANTVMTGLCRLDIGPLNACEVSVRAVVYDTASGLATSLPVSGDHESVIATLRAAVTVAGCVRPQPGCCAGRFADAALADPFGFQCARNDGHTHCLLLLSQPTTNGARWNILDQIILGPRLAYWPAEVGRLVSQRRQTYSQSIEEVIRCEADAPESIALLQPRDRVRTFEMSPVRLRRGFEEGYRTAAKTVRFWSEREPTAFEGLTRLAR